jgi:hypothetical protein
VEQAERRVRDLTWNPQRYITADRDDPRLLRLIANKIGRAANEPPFTDHAARRNWFRELQQLTAQLRPLVADQLREAEADLDRARAEVQANAVLRRRDFAWVLYPEATLRPFLQRFLAPI